MKFLVLPEMKFLVLPEIGIFLVLPEMKFRRSVEMKFLFQLK